MLRKNTNIINSKIKPWTFCTSDSNWFTSTYSGFKIITVIKRWNFFQRWWMWHTIHDMRFRIPLTCFILVKRLTILYTPPPVSLEDRRVNVSKDSLNSMFIIPPSVFPPVLTTRAWAEEKSNEALRHSLRKSISIGLPLSRYRLLYIWVSKHLHILPRSNSRFYASRSHDGRSEDRFVLLNYRLTIINNYSMRPRCLWSLHIQQGRIE